MSRSSSWTPGARAAATTRPGRGRTVRTSPTRCPARAPTHAEGADVEVRYEPGAGLAAVAGDGAALLEGTVDGRVAEAVLAALRAGADVAGLLEALGAGAGADLRALPGFVVVVREGGRLRVVVRGAATVRALTPDGARTVDAAGVTTWTEVALPPGTSLEVTGGRGAGDD